MGHRTKCLLRKLKESLNKDCFWIEAIKGRFLASEGKMHVCQLHSQSFLLTRPSLSSSYHLMLQNTDFRQLSQSAGSTQQLQGPQAAMQHKFSSSNRNPDSHILPNAIHLHWQTQIFLLSPQKTELGELCPTFFMYCLLSFQHPLQLT